MCGTTASSIMSACRGESFLHSNASYCRLRFGKGGVASPDVGLAYIKRDYSGAIDRLMSDPAADKPVSVKVRKLSSQMHQLGALPGWPYY